MKEATLVVLKPDAIQKRLTSKVLERFSHTGLKLTGAKVVRVSRELAETHYGSLKDKPFYGEIVRYLMGEFHNVSETLALVYEGENAVQEVRNLTGATHPEDAEPHTLRGAHGRIHSRTGIFENVVHASSSPEDAEREIKLWFQPEELVSTLYPTEEIQPTLKKKVWKK
jgi:nucleoside-diphosphate kinase